MREMAAAAVAVVSLEQKIVRLLNPSQSKIDLPRSELESICEDVYYWQLFLQTMSNDSANGLQTQIADLAQKIEYAIESYTSEWNRSESESCVDMNLAFGFFQEIVQLKPKINSLTKRLESEREKHKTNNQRPSSSFAAESDTTKMVGRVDELEELNERVFGGDYPIISIVGMAGIGKTTLAKELYYNPICLDHFQIRLFLTVGPLVLGQLGFRINEMCGENDVELKEHLRCYLYGKRYLIVLDDIWGTRVWHEIEQLFPDVEFKSKINSLTKTMESAKEKHYTNNQRPSSSFAAESDTTKIVGLVDELEELKRRVFETTHRRIISIFEMAEPTHHRIISIVGMAGIGKTTLAKELYYNPICQDLFELRLFLTVGPQYQPRQLLLLALGQLGFRIDEMCGKKVSELKEHLLHLLYDKMYLIVLDDIWDTQVWHEIEQLFPNNKNGSRIIMTTRLRNVSGHPSSDMLVPFLNDDESWSLLCRMVFTRDQESSSCDYQLEKIGRKIAKNCEGLPLAIVEVGKLLCKIERNVESWKEIAEREDPLVITIDDGTPISNTLSLSYEMLPQRLKSCFLYMGVFPKDYEIRTSKLIKLWVSEGFIEKTSSSSSKRLEKIAEEYLLELVWSNLVLVCKKSSRGRIKTCRIHFVFRNICISEACNKKLFHVIKKYPNSFPNRPQRLVLHNNTLLGFKQVHNSLLKSDSDPRSLLCFGPQHPFPLRLYLNFPSLRVFDAVTIRFYKFPHQVVELVELRYLAITYDAEIPPSISALCDLEVLIVRRHHESLKYSEAPVYLPMEIWKLQKLRHLQCMGYDLRDPSKEYGFDGFVTLENLSTLSGVSAHSCNREVLERIPNLMKLVIRIESPDNVIEISDLFRDLRLLKCLESFKCVVVNPIIGSQVVAIIPYFFPTNIRKITLSGCGFSWRDMTYIGSILNLQVLKLRKCAFRGAEWATNEYEFTGLEVLLLEDLDIEHWITNPRHFPNLRCLIIRHCYKLREIPRRIFECFSRLEMIEVDDCRPSLVISARKIQKQQQMIRKMSFELRIHHSWDDKRLKP